MRAAAKTETKIIIRNKNCVSAYLFCQISRADMSNDSDSLGKLPMNVQAGTGSWAFFGGLVATYATILLDGYISYRASTETDEFRVGNIVRADASRQYRLFPTNLTTNTNPFINGV